MTKEMNKIKQNNIFFVIFGFIIIFFIQKKFGVWEKLGKPNGKLSKRLQNCTIHFLILILPYLIFEHWRSNKVICCYFSGIRMKEHGNFIVFIAVKSMSIVKFWYVDNKYFWIWVLVIAC